MPPKVATGQRGNGSVAVGSTHPANVAAAKKKAATTATGGDAAVLTRMPPPHDAKSVASARIAEQMSPPVRVPVASVAPAMVETMPSVSIAFVGNETERLPMSMVPAIRVLPSVCPRSFPCGMFGIWHAAAFSLMLAMVTCCRASVACAAMLARRVNIPC